MIVASGTVIGSLVVMFLYSIQLTGIFLLFMVVSMLITRIRRPQEPEKRGRASGDHR